MPIYHTDHMIRCPLCAGTGELMADSGEMTVNELAELPAKFTTDEHAIRWHADMRRLLGLLHKAVIDDQIERDAERRKKKAT
jgi:hypothetical protein